MGAFGTGVATETCGQVGTSTVKSTVSIQNVASILSAWAFGALAVALKAMLSVPPPKRGLAGSVEIEMMIVDVMAWDAMWSRSSVAGSVSIAWVIVPAAMKGARSCGIRAVSALVAV